MYDVTVGAIGLGVEDQLFIVEKIKITIYILYINLYISIFKEEKASCWRGRCVVLANDGPFNRHRNA